MYGRNSASDEYLYLPARAGKAALEEFGRRMDADVRLGWGIESLDSYVVPMMPGDLTTLIARPSMGKTTAMIHLARQANIVLQERAPDEKSYIVYVTWETLVEEFVAIKHAALSGVTLESIGRGSADLMRLTDCIAHGVTERVAVVGMSMAGSDERRRASRMPTLQDVGEVLDEMIGDGRRPALIFYDYLQRIPGAPGKDRTLAVSENLELIKDFSLQYRVPSVVGVQAKRDVDDYAFPRIPNIGDGQWTSNIEQTSDKVFGLFLDSGILYTRTLKQRWGPSGKTFRLNLDPSLGVLTESESSHEQEEVEVF